MRKILLAFCAIIVCTFFTNIVFGQVSLTTMNTAVTENFDTLANSGTANTVVPAGWTFAESGSGGNTTYAAGTGSGNGGNTYSFGSVALPTDRAFGGLQSGTVNPTVGGSFINNTGSTVTLLTIAYTGEQWRLGATARVDQLDFQYSTDATSLTTGTWTDVNTLDFAAPIQAGTVGALDGNLAANRTTINGAIDNLNLANGATIWIRWNDLNAAGADDGLGVDDFSITPSDPLEIVTTNTLPNGDVGVAYPNPIVAAGGVAPYTYVVTGGGVPTGLTLNPNGTWSGSPTTSGTYGFDVQVTDSNPFTNVSNLKYNPIAKFAPTAPNTKTESFIVTINVPTAAGSLVKGRLLTSNGRGLSNALVVLTDSTTGEMRTIRSSAFGHFTFEDCATGHFYILEVQSKKYMFNQQTFTLNGDLTDLVLTAQ